MQIISIESLLASSWVNLHQEGNCGKTMSVAKKGIIFSFAKSSYYRYKPLNPNYDVLLKSEPRGKIKSQNGFL